MNKSQETSPQDQEVTKGTKALTEETRAIARQICLLRTKAPLWALHDQTEELNSTPLSQINFPIDEENSYEEAIEDDRIARCFLAPQADLQEFKDSYSNNAVFGQIIWSCASNYVGTFSASVLNKLQQLTSFWREVLKRLGLAEPSRISTNTSGSRVFFEWKTKKEVESFCVYTHDYKSKKSSTSTLISQNNPGNRIPGHSRQCNSNQREVQSRTLEEEFLQLSLCNRLPNGSHIERQDHEPGEKQVQCDRLLPGQERSLYSQGHWIIGFRYGGRRHRRPPRKRPRLPNVHVLFPRISPPFPYPPWLNITISLEDAQYVSIAANIIGFGANSSDSIAKEAVTSRLQATT